jgi:hypothetical protein
LSIATNFENDKRTLNLRHEQKDHDIVDAMMSIVLPNKHQSAITEKRRRQRLVSKSDQTKHSRPLDDWRAAAEVENEPIQRWQWRQAETMPRRNHQTLTIDTQTHQSKHTGVAQMPSTCSW